MQTQIVNILQVTPETYWQQLFFDPEYHRALYDRLAFPSCEVELLERDDNGRVRRVIRAKPPVHAPDFIRRKLGGRLQYVEDGTYDPTTGLWTFTNEVSMAKDHVAIRGAIRTDPVAQGLRHVLDLDAKVNVFGLGPVFEHLIEKNTRDSYTVMAAFTNEFARKKGLLAPS